MTIPFLPPVKASGNTVPSLSLVLAWWSGAYFDSAGEWLACTFLLIGKKSNLTGLQTQIAVI